LRFLQDRKWFIIESCFGAIMRNKRTVPSTCLLVVKLHANKENILIMPRFLASQKTQAVKGILRAISPYWGFLEAYWTPSTST
jgi:hypothetical protein